MRKFLIAIVLAGVIGGAYGLLLDWDQQYKIDKAPTPEALASVILDDRPVKATTEGGTLSLEYDIGSTLSASTAVAGFNLNTAKIVPRIFARFPAISSVNILALGPFVDIRGNRSTQPALRITFSRSNAASVQWDGIVWSNVPKIADGYWADPRMTKM